MITYLKTVSFLLAGIISTAAVAEMSVGQKISPARKTDGQLQLGIQYAPSSKMVAVTFSVNGSDLVGAKAASILPAHWAFFDKATSVQLSAWANLTDSVAVVEPSSTQSFTLAVPSADSSLVARSLSRSVIALSIQEQSETPSVTQFIDIEELCASSPASFINLDTMESGCK
ncbi:MAG: hypothetical protein EOP05_01435 [Proteobacteria bacterium]|nr:MAG: hypothetical protein EOP05_01435 [Pseudomonadota bacterium]